MSDDPFDFLEEEPVEAIVLTGSPVEKRREHEIAVAKTLQSIEREIYDEAAPVCRDAMHAFSGDIVEKDGQYDFVPDEDWETQLGPKKAKRRKRTAIAALQSNKNAPYALKMATSLTASIGRNQSNHADNTRPLNIQMVVMPVVQTKYEELEVEE